MIRCGARRPAGASRCPSISARSVTISPSSAWASAARGVGSIAAVGRWANSSMQRASGRPSRRPAVAATAGPTPIREVSGANRGLSSGGRNSTVAVWRGLAAPGLWARSRTLAGDAGMMTDGDGLLGEAREMRRKRLAHRSRYRGIKEGDLLFGQFAARHLMLLSDAQLDRYEAL